MTLSMAVAPATIVQSNEYQPSSSIASKIQSWLGHTVSAVGTTVVGVGQKVIVAASDITGDSCATASILRKLDHHVLRWIEHIKNAPGSFSQFQQMIRRSVCFIDLAQICADVHYVATGRFKEVINEKGQVEKEKDNDIMIAGKLAGLAANTGGALLWFNEMGMISLTKAAETIGEVRLFSAIPSLISSIPALNDFPKLHAIANAVGEFRAFSFVKHTSCLFVTLRALDFMYACFAVDAAQRLMNADSRIKAIAAGLDLSSYLSELTLSAIMLAGVTNVVSLGVVGTTCIAFAVSSFLYKVANEQEIKRKV